MSTETFNEDIPSIVAEEIDAAQRAGIPPCEQSTYVADRLRFRIAGTEQYVRRRSLTPAQRAEEIRKSFNGRNARELARAYQVSVRRVQQIVNGRG